MFDTETFYVFSEKEQSQLVPVVEESHVVSDVEQSHVVSDLQYTYVVSDVELSMLSLMYNSPL